MQSFKFALTILLLQNFITANSQTLKTYIGAYEGKSTKGNSTYKYYDGSNGDRIYNGLFIYQDKDKSIQIKGFFKNGKKDSIWTWIVNEKRHLTPYTLFGDRISGMISGKYKYGNREGAWITKLVIKNQMRINIMGEESVINYRNNIRMGKYHSNSEKLNPNDFGNKKNDVTGSFDENGLKDGIWFSKSVTEDNIIYTETYNYKHGLISSYAKKNLSTGKTENETYDLPYLNILDDGRDITDWVDIYSEISMGSNPIIYYNLRDTLALAGINEDKKLHPEFYDPITGNRYENTINIKPKADRIIVDQKVQDTNSIARRNSNDTASTESDFPGGADTWLRYLNKNLRYPDEGVDKNIQGTVVVQFIVDKEGNVSDVQAISGPIDGGLREEAIRVIKKSGKWNPAKQNGINIVSIKKRPIVFKLQTN